MGRWPVTRRVVTKRAQLQLTGVEKFVSAGTRKVQGIASSISVDLAGDIVVPSGGKWQLPLVLLWQHKHDTPIGWVTSLQVRGDVIWMEAEIASGVRQADEAWSMIEAGLVNSFSIGFRGLKWEQLPTGGRKYTEWGLHEISAVTLPANPDARMVRPGVSASAKRSAAIPLVKAPAGSIPLNVSRAKSPGSIPLKVNKPGIPLKRADGAIKLIGGRR